MLQFWPDILTPEGLTLETSAFESLYGGQVTLSTQLTKPNYLVILPPTQHHSFFRNLPPLLKNQPCDILAYLISVIRSFQPLQNHGICHCSLHYYLSSQVGLKMRRKLRSGFPALKVALPDNIQEKRLGNEVTLHCFVNYAPCVCNTIHTHRYLAKSELENDKW